jgi:hypothetical protein
VTIPQALARGLASLAIIAIVASCQGRPPDSVALSVYHRNLAEQPFTYQVLGTLPGEENWIGLVPDVVSSGGCGFVGRNWQVVVVEGDEQPDPAGPIAASLSAADIGNPETAALSITVLADGSVEIETGVPEWWDSDLQRCPGS